MRTLSTSLAALLAGVASVPATAAETKCTIGQMLELPVTMTGLKPLVPATINGKPVKLMVDSGAFYSLISPGSAAELGLRLTAAPNGARMRGAGGDASISIAKVKEFGLGPAKLNNVEFIVGGSETGSTGLLGQNVLRVGDVEYDLAGAAIRLMRPHNCDKANLAYWAGEKPVSQLEIDPPSPLQPHTMGTVILNGVKIRAMFDTGASTSALTIAAAARAGIRSDSPGVEPAGYGSGLGRRLLPTWIGPFQSLKIGDEEIRKIRLRFSDIGNGGDFDMLIGADFFLSHRVYVSNAQHRMFFTYNGGPVFDLTVRKSDTPAGATVAAQPMGENGGPATAEEFSLRGNALAARRDFAGALADLTRAGELAPDNAEYRYQRAVILQRSERRAEALADLDRALSLKPDYAEALLFRASLRRHDNKPGARADADAADRAVSASSDLRLALAGFYADVDDYPRAIAQYDRWIAAHPDDRRLPSALNGSCWQRALAGIDLDRAIDDCDKALRLRPKTPAFLDSRGLARLRSGQLDKALADYNAALAIQPKMAWSLYGRGIIAHRKGQAAQASADIAAAVALQPGLPAEARRIGLEVPN